MTRLLVFFCLALGLSINRNEAQEVSCAESEPQDLPTLPYQERLFWQEGEDFSRVVSYVLEGPDGQPVLCYCFSYDEEGKVTQEDLVGNLSGHCSAPLIIGEEGYPLANGIESCSRVYSELPEEKEQATATVRVNCSCIKPWEGRAKAGYRCRPRSLFVIDLVWEHLSRAFFTCFQYIQRSVHLAKSELSAELSLPPHIEESLESAVKQLVGEPIYLLMGHIYEETEVGCYGKREVNDKVRVTFINGILTLKETMFDNIKTISECHGGQKIHYVFRPTEGWTWDISRAIMIRTAFTLGFRSQHAYALASLWRELIKEMGGVGQGGVIIHYAHSLGSSETDRARDLLTPEEQNMIRVITFGPATFIRNKGFRSVINYVSVKDGVSSIILEPLGYIGHCFDPHSSVHFRGMFFASPFWPLDHLLGGTTYGPIVRQLGEEFLKEFEVN
jgi:hypothetical protein